MSLHLYLSMTGLACHASLFTTMRKRRSEFAVITRILAPISSCTVCKRSLLALPVCIALPAGSAHVAACTFRCLMELPTSTGMAPCPSADSYLRIRQWLQWSLVAFCIVVTFMRLEGPCNLEHKYLNDIELAKAEFHGRSRQTARSQQYWKWPEDPDSCAAKVRDINSWVDVQPSKPPFHFPKFVFQTVEDKHNISCEVLECMQTWKDMNPGYEHKLFDATDRETFIREYYPELHPVYSTLSTNVERADLWRYLALHKYGGVYADSDVRCIKPIKDWNAVNSYDADMLVGVVYTDNQGMVTRVNNFIIAAMPCHPVMAAMPFTAMSRIALAGLQGKSVGGETGKALSEAVIGRTGPAALTATIGDYAKRLGAQWPVNGTAGAEGAGQGNLVSTIRLMPRNILTMGWETAAEKITCDEALKRNPEAYICHQYFGTWKATYNHRPALTYSDNCTYWGINKTAMSAYASAATGTFATAQDSLGAELGALYNMESLKGFEQTQQEMMQLNGGDETQKGQQAGLHTWHLNWGDGSSSEQQSKGDVVQDGDSYDLADDDDDGDSEQDMESEESDEQQQGSHQMQQGTLESDEDIAAQ